MTKYSIQEIQSILMSHTPQMYGLHKGHMMLALKCYDIAYSNDYEITVRHAMDVYGEVILSDILQNIWLLDNTFGFGLAGIAWGVCLLIGRNQLEGDTDMLEDLDRKISEVSLYRCDKSLMRGLEGYLHYTLARIKCDSYTIGLSPHYFTELDDIVNQLPCEANMSLTIIADMYKRYRKNNELIYSIEREYTHLANKF